MIKVTVPGSVMLMGEHAVLQGEKALACAVNKYIHIELLPLASREVKIDSALAQYHSHLDDLQDNAKLSFVIAAIKSFAAQLNNGFELKIRAEFSHKVGLGSSAAVTAGVVAALCELTGAANDKASVFDRALQVVHKVQDGRGSGTDLVASIYGALVSYRVKPREIKALEVTPQIGLVYAGYKTTTPDVLKSVEVAAQQSPESYQQLYRLMGDVTDRAEQAAQAEDWTRLALYMNQYHGLLDALGVSDKVLSEIVYSLRAQKDVLGAKISGSGLGDCVIALYSDSASYREAGLAGFDNIPVAVAEKGICIEHH